MRHVLKNVTPTIMGRTVRKHASVLTAVHATMSLVRAIANQDSLVHCVKRDVPKEPMVKSAKMNAPARTVVLVILLQENVTVPLVGRVMFVVTGVQRARGVKTANSPVNVLTEQLVTTSLVNASVCQDLKEISV